MKSAKTFAREVVAELDDLYPHSDPHGKLLRLRELCEAELSVEDDPVEAQEPESKLEAQEPEPDEEPEPKLEDEEPEPKLEDEGPGNARW